MNIKYCFVKLFEITNNEIIIDELINFYNLFALLEK